MNLFRFRVQNYSKSRTSTNVSAFYLPPPTKIAIFPLRTRPPSPVTLKFYKKEGEKGTKRKKVWKKAAVVHRKPYLCR